MRISDWSSDVCSSDLLRLGADFAGQRLNQVYRENVDEAAILGALDPLFARYAAERGGAEGFGDFLLRTGVLAHAPSRGLPAREIGSASCRARVCQYV